MTPTIGKQLLTTDEASVYLKEIYDLSRCRRTLEKMRTTGKGPKFKKLGNNVRYRPGDLDAWVNGAPVYTSTSDTGRAAA